MRQIRRWTAVAAVAVAAVGGGFGGGTSIAPAVSADCRAQPPAATAPEKRQRPPVVLPRVGRVPSPADRLNLADLDLATTLTQMRDFRVVDEFDLPSSGVRIRLKSDGSIRADVAAVDEILHARLRLHDVHPDPAMRQRMRCFKQTIIDERAFRGAVVNMYVTADPRMCIKNLRLVLRPDGGRWDRHCHWRGATPPVRLSSVFGEVRLTEYHVVIAPGVSRWSDLRPDPVVAQILRHEADHLWDWMIGASPVNVRANERRALHGDMLVDRIYAAGGKPLPNPFFYPGGATAAAQSG